MNDIQGKILNRNVMRDLIGDDEVLTKKFHIEFLKQAKISLNKIALCFNSNDFTAIKEEAHFLKTSAKAIGAEKTAYLLENLEIMALAKEKEKCKQHIIDINATLKQVYGEIVNGC
ncbi:MAG: HPt (histidine-containing phosphotransfer) domain-containing protein [Alteromonadaceae bacterium]|jgi:HPt (histidine-containing phosphotransfer) domain-containing protein